MALRQDRRRPWLIMMVLGIFFVTIAAATATPEQGLRVYGPGGPAGPMKECAALFSEQHRVKVQVVAGPESQWLAQAKQEADIIYGGAEYMLTALQLNNPGLLNPTSRVSLYPRAAGILVRPGNPKGIRSFQDLARDGINLLDVNGAGQLGLWEDLTGRLGLMGKIQKNIRVTVTTSAEAIEMWKRRPELDAWITFVSWHHRLKEDTDLVSLPPEQKILRGTPAAIATGSQNRKLAEEFLNFLQSPQAQAVFQKWGWE